MAYGHILLIALIGVAAFAGQWLAWRAKLPAILFLLGAGLLLGPALGLLDPDALFGDLLFPLISLSVAVILFEGSLTLNFQEIAAQKRVVRRLVMWGAPVTWAVVALATRGLFGLSWELSVLFGALMVVTGPTVVIPMLRTVQPNANVANILRWEGILIDPIGALLVVVVYEFIVAQSDATGLLQGALAFLRIVASGSLLGISTGWAFGYVLRRGWIPNYLLNLATLSVVFAVFAAADYLARESGLLAVTLLGMWLANQRGIHIGEILNFKENLSIVLISGLFILLAARLTVDNLTALGGTALLLLLVIQLLARPLSVWLSTIGSTLNWREKALMSWIAPRGIVAAAVSAFFAIQLYQAGEPAAGLLVPLTFSVIIGTVVLQSATARPLARLLGVAVPAPTGFLVVGANPLARALAGELRDLGFRTVLADAHWDNVSAARMEGLETFYGHPVSNYADEYLDLVGIGRLLAVSPADGINAVAAMRYHTEFGGANIYTLSTTKETETPEKHKLATQRRGKVLFGPDITYQTLASRLTQGAEIRRTRLSETYTFSEFLHGQGRGAIPLFALSPRGRLEIFVAGENVRPDAGWTLVSLHPQGDKVENKKSAKAIRQ